MERFQKLYGRVQGDFRHRQKRRNDHELARSFKHAFAHSFEHAYQPSDNAHIFVRYFQKNQGLHDLSDSAVPSRDDFRNRFVLRVQDVHKRQSGGFQ